MKKIEIFSKSENYKEEYSCSVIRVGELRAIEGSDFLATTLINGMQSVVRKGEIREGDVLFYASNETELAERFLAVNNQFGPECCELNSNAAEVEELRKKLLAKPAAEEAEEIKKRIRGKCGYFNKYGRVRMIKLRGEASMGYLFSQEAMGRFCPQISDVQLENYVGTDFDTVCGELFVKAYVPRIKERPKRERSTKKQRKIERFDRMIPGEFLLHYDTEQLERHIAEIRPDDVVSISVKLHGTSICMGNVRTKVPLRLPLHKRLFNWFVDSTGLLKTRRITDFRVEFGNVYSSRTVIKNKYINQDVTGGYYDADIWTEIGEMMRPFLSEGMTVYGEICGYLTDSEKMIQKDYDYGCEVGRNFLMPYRITTAEGGTRREWNVTEVRDWTEQLLAEHSKLVNRLCPITILYHGTLRDLYPEIPTETHWHENILERMKRDKRTFGMEQNESLCKKKVPREGICLRIDNDPRAECFKLKTNAFRFKEMAMYDSGEAEDIEVGENNY